MIRWHCSLTLAVSLSDACLRLPENPIVTFNRKMVPEGNMRMAVFRDILVL